MVTFASANAIRTGPNLSRTGGRICALRRCGGNANHRIPASFRSKLEGRSTFSWVDHADTLKKGMFQHRDRLSADHQTPVEFSERDRQDAARLLTLVLGSSAADRAIRDRDPVEIARAILEDRRRRCQIFNPGMFGEPAWELLLNLYVMDKHGPRLTIGQLIQIAGVAQATALRWLEYLRDQELITREEHPTDARTAYVALTDKAREALSLYLCQTLTPRI
jgi:DNA-binding MarR family transcriptional regulator